MHQWLRRREGKPFAGTRHGVLAHGSALKLLLAATLAIAMLAVALLATPVQATTSQESNVKTVFLILMENKDWSTIKGNSNAPYINSLLPNAAYANNYMTTVHPSLPNYLVLESGSTQGITTDCDPTPTSCSSSSTSHLATLLKNASPQIPYTEYAEGISGTDCPLTTDTSTNYYPKHNPFVYFHDDTNDESSTSAYCINHERPFSELATNLGNNAVHGFNFITPNICDDMHTSCNGGNEIKQGDDWLKANLPTILNSSVYQSEGAVLIVWDEGTSGSNGPIGCILLSPFGKTNYSNTIAYSHNSTLRTMQDIFNVKPYIGGAANATGLDDLFAPATGPTNTPTNTPLPTATNTPGPTATPTATSTPGSDNDVLDINAGGSAASPFVADEDFSGGTTGSITHSIDTSTVVDPAPQAVYQSRRAGTGTGCNCFTYTITGLTTGNGYTVRLQFAEHAKTGSGQREFNVSINGTQVLTNFDIFAAAGGEFKAISEAFAATADSNGDITISFTPGAIDNPLVNGIEIEAGSSATPTPTATPAATATPTATPAATATPTATSTPSSDNDVLDINAGGSAAAPFVADEDFSGGAANSITHSIDTSTVVDPAPQAVYQTRRNGTGTGCNCFTYTIPGLTPGAGYTVRLQFAEHAKTGPNEREFDVSINPTASD